MKTIPDYEEFKEYAFKKLNDIGDSPNLYTEWIYFKYSAWEANNWCKTIKDKDIPIKNWKTTLLQCLPYREINKAKQKQDSKVISITQRLANGYN